MKNFFLPTFLRPTLDIKLGVVFLGFFLLAFSDALLVDGLLDNLRGMAPTINVASRLRMISQKIEYLANRIAWGEVADDKELKNFVAAFEEGLLALETGGEAYGWDVRALPQDIVPRLIKIRHEWKKYRNLVNELNRYAEGTRERMLHLHTLGIQGDVILYNTESLANQLTLVSEIKTDRTRIRIYKILALNCFLLLIALYIVRRRIIAPIRYISKAAKEIASGGRTVRVNFSSYDEIGELAHAFNRMTEEIREAEEELKKIQRAVENSSDAICILEPKGPIIFQNKAFLQMLEYPPEERVTRQDRQLHYANQSMADDVFETLRQGHSWSGEIDLETLYGHTIPVLLTADAIRNEEGEIIAFIFVHTDITERKRLERLKDDFVSTVSHELRTPLAIINGASKNLRDGIAGALLDKQKEVIERIYDNAHYLEKMVVRLLELSRLESGRARINRKQIDILFLFNEVLRNFEEMAQKKGITLISDFPPHLELVFVDSEMLQQIIINLLSNALRFAKRKVIVKVRAYELDHISHAEVRERKKEDKLLSQPGVEITVIDDGPGIAGEDMAGLFSKFKQIQRVSGEQGYKGTGLGLALCKKMIDLHLGRIWVESEVGEGTQFHFYLPTKGGEEHET